MLLQFTVENFRSIREPVTLSMIAADHVAEPADRAYDVPGIGRVLKVVAVYGANASGKSNLVDAWTYLCWLASFGVPVGRGLLYEPFKLDPAWATRPTQFDVHFVVGSVRYAYGLAFDATQVVSEWLLADDALVFRRERGAGPSPEVRWGSAGPVLPQRSAFYEHVGEGTRHEQPLLAELRSRNAHEFAAVERVLRVGGHGGLVAPGHQVGGLELSAIIGNIAAYKQDRDFLVRAVAQLATGVIGIRFRSQDGMTAKLLNEGGSIEYERSKALAESGELTVEFLHAGGALEFGELSAGTQRLLGLSIHLHALSTFRVPYCLDELDRSFHTALTQRLLEIVVSDICNDGAQLIFTTHDTNLLDAGLLGADGIWFVEKDRDGASHLSSLAEFDADELRALVGSLEEGYLEGRFGAIPFAGKRPSGSWAASG